MKNACILFVYLHKEAFYFFFMAKESVISKSQIVDEIASDCGVSKAMAAKVLDSFFEVVADNVAKGGKVALTGWFSLTNAERKARVGINPRTKQKVKYPAKKYVKAKLGNKWKNPSRRKKK